MRGILSGLDYKEMKIKELKDRLWLLENADECIVIGGSKEKEIRNIRRAIKKLRELR